MVPPPRAADGAKRRNRSPSLFRVMVHSQGAEAVPGIFAAEVGDAGGHRLEHLLAHVGGVVVLQPGLPGPTVDQRTVQLHQLLPRPRVLGLDPFQQARQVDSGTTEPDQSVALPLWVMSGDHGKTRAAEPSGLLGSQPAGQGDRQHTSPTRHRGKNAKSSSPFGE